MLIQDLNYLETASDNIEGAFALAAVAAASLASGVNVAETADFTAAAAQSQLVDLGGGIFIPQNDAAGLAGSFAFAS